MRDLGGRTMRDLAGRPGVVEAAGPDDVAAITSVLAAAYAEFTGGFRPTALRQTEDDVAGNLAAWSVARVDGRVAACVMRYPEADYFTFCFLATEPGARGRGLGSALVDAALDAARAAGRRYVRIVLRRSLSRNVAFFARRGFGYLEPFGTGEHDLYQLDLAEL